MTTTPPPLDSFDPASHTVVMDEDRDLVVDPPFQMWRHRLVGHHAIATPFGTLTVDVWGPDYLSDVQVRAVLARYTSEEQSCIPTT